MGEWDYFNISAGQVFVPLVDLSLSPQRYIDGWIPTT